MSVKRQILSFCKLFSFYKEKTKDFLDEIEGDCFFYHNSCDNSGSQHRIVRICKGCNRKCFAFKFFQFCDSKTQQRYIFQEKVKISIKNFSSLLDSLRNFLKNFDKARECLQIPLPKPKIEVGSTKSKHILFAYSNNAIIQHLNKKIRLLIRFGNNNSSVFPIEKFKLQGNQFILTEFVNLNHRQIHHL